MNSKLLTSPPMILLYAVGGVLIVAVGILLAMWAALAYLL
jgi:hypothetical protein